MIQFITNDLKGYTLLQAEADVNTEELRKKIAEQAEEIKQLKKQKKFGLVWEDKPDAQVLRVRDEAPMLCEDTFKAVVADKNAVDHILINGDNFHALTALRATHMGKVDVIYIDPPYNTGNKDFIYNDNYLDKEDGYRHSKWISFMEKRLTLAKELLSEAGVIFVSIDDNEQARLKLLMDEIFGAERFVANVIRATNSTKNNAKTFSVNHEYCLVYSMLPVEQMQGTKWVVDKNNVGEYVKRAKSLQDKGISKEELTSELKELTSYPRFIDLTNYWYSDERGIYRKDNLGGVKDGNLSPVLNPLTGNYDPVPPGGFRYSNAKLMELINDDRIHFHIDGSLPTIKRYLAENLKQNPKSIMSDDQRPDNTMLKKMGLNFDNPKQLSFMERILSIFDKEVTILDFFAGSGTTAHAVAKLNKQDGGMRQSILITDGGKIELTGESSKYAKENAVNIAEEITYERVRRVLTGQDWADGKEHEPLGGNLRYFKVEMEPVASGLTELDQRFSLEKYAVEHAKIAANIFNEILSKDEFDKETGMLVDYKVFADEVNECYLVGVNSHDYALSELEEWFKGLPESASVVMVGNGLEEIEWVKKNSNRITVDDVLGRVIRSRKYVASKLPLV